MLDLTKDEREETFNEIKQSNAPELKNLGIVSREKWETFVKQVQEDCPSISYSDLEKISSLLIKLENSQSKFSILHTLANSTSEQLDDLQDILHKWDIDFAKIVLDEIEYRSNLIEKLLSKVQNPNSDEVQELQPLFHRGLWIFGPEYETIEYTSNEGMTKVIQKLYKEPNIKGTRIRPDFAILEDSTVGLYSLPKFGSTGEITGIDKLTIVELKRPGIPIGDEQKDQAWKYVKELLSLGLISNNTYVNCFVLGSSLKPFEGSSRTENNAFVNINPVEYDTIMRRAKSRLLNLYDKVKNSPFLQETRARQFMLEKSQTEIFA